MISGPYGRSNKALANAPVLDKNIFFMERVKRRLADREDLSRFFGAGVTYNDAAKIIDSCLCHYGMTKKEMDMLIRQNAPCPLRLPVANNALQPHFSTAVGQYLNRHGGGDSYLHCRRHTHYFCAENVQPQVLEQSSSEFYEVLIEVPNNDEKNNEEVLSMPNLEAASIAKNMLVLPECPPDCVYCRKFGRNIRFEYPPGGLEEALKMFDERSNKDSCNMDSKLEMTAASELDSFVPW